MNSWRDKVTDYKFTFLLISLLGLVVGPMIVGQAATRSLTSGLSFIVVLIFGVFATARHRRARIVAGTLGLFAVIAQIVTFILGPNHHPELRLAAFAAFLGYLVVVIVHDVLIAEKVTWDKIQGAICAYLLVGVAWAVLYEWIGLTNPQAFTGVTEASATISIDSMIYFSFVTLTTLGYGDITPVTQTTRTLAWLEAAFGQIYLTVLVARLVSLQLTRSGDGRR